MPQCDSRHDWSPDNVGALSRVSGARISLQLSTVQLQRIASLGGATLVFSSFRRLRLAFVAIHTLPLGKGECALFATEAPP